MVYSFGGIPLFEPKQYGAVIRGIVHNQRDQMLADRQFEPRVLRFECPTEWVTKMHAELRDSYMVVVDGNTLVVTIATDARDRTVQIKSFTY